MKYFFPYYKKSKMFKTFFLSADPPEPPTPELIDVGDETLTVHLKPVLATNGPISAYQVVVIDESSPVVFNPKMLSDWNHASSEGIPYYIAAEIPPEVSSISEFWNWHMK